MADRVFSSLLRRNDSGGFECGISMASELLPALPDDGLKTFKQCRKDCDDISMVVASWMLTIKDDVMGHESWPIDVEAPRPVLETIDQLQQFITLQSSMITKLEYDDDLKNLPMNLRQANTKVHSITTSFAKFKETHIELIESLKDIGPSTKAKLTDDGPSKKAKLTVPSALVAADSQSLRLAVDLAVLVASEPQSPRALVAADAVLVAAEAVLAADCDGTQYKDPVKMPDSYCDGHSSLCQILKCRT
jgi:hypothetical protein